MAKDHSSSDAITLQRGAYSARFAVTADDIEGAQRLRHLCFVEKPGLGAGAATVDRDAFDALCDHILIEDALGELVCCFRILMLDSGADIHISYAAQFYDLKRFSRYDLPMIEMGRFCVRPDVCDGDVLRIAWGMLAAVVDAHGAGMLFGCSSFAGTNAADYAQGFDILAGRHLAPAAWMPQPKSPNIVDFAGHAAPVVDRQVAMGQVPPLLKTYLSMGGWVSDHAVIDADLNTLHVFTGLEIAAIPPARAKALRAIAG